MTCANGDCPAPARKDGYCPSHWYSWHHNKVEWQPHLNYISSDIIYMTQPVGGILDNFNADNHVKNSQKQEPVITRLEIIEDERTVLVSPTDGKVITYDIQDEGRTLKVFVNHVKNSKGRV